MAFQGTGVCPAHSRVPESTFTTCCPPNNGPHMWGMGWSGMPWYGCWMVKRAVQGHASAVQPSLWGHHRDSDGSLLEVPCRRQWSFSYPDIIFRCSIL